MKYNVILNENQWDLVYSLLGIKQLTLLMEKTIEVGGSLERVLKDEGTDLSMDILNFLKSDDIKDSSIVSKIDFTNNDNRSFTLHQNKGDKGRIESVRINKALKALGYNLMKVVDNLPQNKKYQLNNLLNAFATRAESGIAKADKGNVYGKSETPYELKMINGDKIKWAYLCDNYDDENPDYDSHGGLANSCMRFSKVQDDLTFYSDHPKHVSLLVAINKNNGKVMGRALVWNTTIGKYMDRIYTINTGFDKVFELYAKSNGMLLYGNVSSANLAKMEVVFDYDVDDIMDFPDLDTFEERDNKLLTSLGVVLYTADTYLDDDTSPVVMFDLFKIDLKSVNYIIDELLKKKITKKIGVKFWNNGFTQIPKKIFKIDNIVHLGLSANPFTDIGDEILSLKDLRSLIINFTDIKVIPVALYKMPYLDVVKIEYNNKLSVEEIEKYRTYCNKNNINLTVKRKKQ